MSEIVLNTAYAGAFFQKMRSVTMAKRMNVNRFCESTFPNGLFPNQQQRLADDRPIQSACARCSTPTWQDVDAIETREVGLLLGTSPRGKNGPNLYFRYRIEAAAQLYHAGKIRKIIVSGDNSRKNYNEPGAMREALEARGVRPEDIYEDYAGFRTLDSVIRADKVFGQKKFTVISQMFHCKRAIYLAERNGIDAIGFSAQDVRAPRFRLKNHLRETLSRSAALLDVLLGRGPRFLGELFRLDQPPPFQK